MRTRTRAWGITWLIASTLPASAQVQNNGAGDYRLNPTNPNTVPQGPKTFTVGNAYVMGQSLLNVRGDLLTGTNQTTEVFRTNAPATANTYWRMFQGGTTAGFERGQLFAEPANAHFNINAPNGGLGLWTNTLQRMKVFPTGTGSLPLLTGGTVTYAQDGFVGISGTPAFFDPGGLGPFSRLHLADLPQAGEGVFHYALPWGYRTWMRNGITFTGNHDHAYVGQRYYGDDETDMVIHWSDNADKSEFGPDRLRFLFTLNNLSSTVGARSEEGLEFMRMFPVDALQGWIGVGNYAQPGLLEPEPTERLDLLDRTIRLRDFAAPSNLYLNPLADRVLVADPVDGRVYWRPASGIGGSAGECDWMVQNETTVGASTPHYVYTAEGTSDACPDKSDLVGIGIIPTTAKLHVQANTVTDGVPPIGVYVHLETSTSDVANGMHVRIDPVTNGYDQSGVLAAVYNGTLKNNGVVGRAYINQAITNVTGNVGTVGSSDITAGTVSVACGVQGDATASPGTVTTNCGLSGTASGGTSAFGVKTSATAAGVNYGAHLDAWGSATTNYGSFALATNASTNFGSYGRGSGTGASNFGVVGYALNGNSNIGVYGEVAGTTSTDWAGYFVGNVNSTGIGYYVNGVFVMSDESLKTDIEPLGSAMDIISLLQPKSYLFAPSDHPHLSMPEGPQAGFLAQEVEEVLPALVSSTSILAAVDSTGQEVSPAVEYKAVNYAGMVPYLIAAVQEQNATIASQNDRLAHMEEMLAACCASPTGSDRMRIEDNGALSGEERLLKIQPNPFSEATTLYYTLERAGRMQLMANSADGKELHTLHEAVLEAGQYQLEWNTTELSPGVYYVTLLLDGEPMVKKAVKVTR